MSRDPIVAEVRRARESRAAEHGFDVKAILSAAKKPPAPLRTHGSIFCPQESEVERVGPHGLSAGPIVVCHDVFVDIRQRNGAAD